MNILDPYFLSCGPAVGKKYGEWIELVAKITFEERQTIEASLNSGIFDTFLVGCVLNTINRIRKSSSRGSWKHPWRSVHRNIVYSLE